jgi:predicted NAD-dependent protein-ADP-ribosyltransferase YbiA (DUF1768 family)
MKRKSNQYVDEEVDQEERKREKKPKIVSNDQQFKDFELSIVQFSSKCKDASLFKGTGEYLHEDDDIESYHSLEQLVPDTSEPLNWRRVLSSHYAPRNPIAWRGKLYTTQEHAISAMKFINYHNDYANKFAIPSNSSFDDDEKHQFWRASKVGLAKALAVKNGKYKTAGKIIDIRPPNVKPEPLIEMFNEYYGDEDRVNEEWNKLVENIAYARFSGDQYSKNVLLATNYALLVESNGRNQTLDIPLMNVRERLRHELAF